MDKKINKNIIKYLKNENVNKIILFGSYLKDKDYNDIDIIVDFKEAKSLLNLVRIERELSELVGKKIDLSTNNSINPLILERIKSEEKIIYEI
jgi:uncharacterized protein